MLPAKLLELVVQKEVVARDLDPAVHQRVNLRQVVLLENRSLQGRPVPIQLFKKVLSDLGAREHGNGNQLDPKVKEKLKLLLHAISREETLHHVVNVEEHESAEPKYLHQKIPLRLC